MSNTPPTKTAPATQIPIRSHVGLVMNCSIGSERMERRSLNAHSTPKMVPVNVINPPMSARRTYRLTFMPRGSHNRIPVFERFLPFPDAIIRTPKPLPQHLDGQLGR